MNSSLEEDISALLEIVASIRQLKGENKINIKHLPRSKRLD